MRKSVAIISGVLGTGLLVVSVLGVGTVYAAANPTSPLGTLENTILQNVINKLHLNVTPDALATTLKDSRLQAITDSVNSQIDQAVKDNKLTKADSDLAKKLITEEQKQRDANTLNPSDLQNLSQAERLLKIDQQRVDNEKQLLSDLGITEDQLTALQTKLRDAGIKMRLGFVGEMGKGGMMRGRARGGFEMM